MSHAIELTANSTVILIQLIVIVCSIREFGNEPDEDIDMVIVTSPLA